MLNPLTLLLALTTAGVTTALPVVTSGINNYNCKSAPGRDPVVMLHGFLAPAAFNWITKAPILAAAGYCVYTPQIGTGLGIGFDGIEDSIGQLEVVVDKVLATTGASKVNLVGHSLGTVVGASYIKLGGHADKVNTFVAIGSAFRGTTLYGISNLLRAIPGVEDAFEVACPACIDLSPPSVWLDRLADGGITVPGPKYYSFVTSRDKIVVPWTSGVLNEPGAVDITINEWCPLDFTGHIAMITDPNVTALILWALKGGSDPRPRCVPYFIPGRRDLEGSVEA